jgi:thiosulfate/3-mercaptopyruvate sulfurtransferase
MSTVRQSLAPVVDTAWLGAHLGEPDLRVVDATWYLPHLKRDARAEFVQAHVPGAVFFDIDRVADSRSPLPHMLPTAEEFASAVGALGIGSGDRVVAYGGRNMIASARAWWMFRVFGHDRVSVLDGGLPRWRAEGRQLEAGPAAPAAGRFTARVRPELVRGLAEVRDNVETRREQVLDARSSGRFAGTEPEPRAGLRSGHIPGSANLPYDRLFLGPDGTLPPTDALRRVFDESGVDLGKPMLTTCGSGVSAAVLTLGLFLLGRTDVPVYDGSWSEWGSRGDTPVTTGG